MCFEKYDTFIKHYKRLTTNSESTLINMKYNFPSCIKAHLMPSYFNVWILQSFLFVWCFILFIIKLVVVMDAGHCIKAEAPVQFCVWAGLLQIDSYVLQIRKWYNDAKAHCRFCYYTQRCSGSKQHLWKIPWINKLKSIKPFFPKETGFFCVSFHCTAFVLFNSEKW